MKTSTLVWVLVANLCLFVGCEAGKEMTENSEGLGRSRKSVSYHPRAADDRCLEGISQLPGLTIQWAGSMSSDQNHVRPVDVLAATIERVKHEQTTNLGSDANARALTLLLQAKAELEGTAREMPDGTPIIE